MFVEKLYVNILPPPLPTDTTRCTVYVCQCVCKYIFVCIHGCQWRSCSFHLYVSVYVYMSVEKGISGEVVLFISGEVVHCQDVRVQLLY